MHSVTVIGTGKVGGSIVEALQEQQCKVVTCSRHQLEVKDKTAWSHLHSSTEDELPTDVIIIAVPDRAIPTVAEHLASVLPNSRNVVVAHTAGAHTQSVLSPLLNMGFHCGVVHPFQTFPVVDPTLLINVPWGIRGDERTVNVLSALVESLDGHALELKGGEVEQALYHATAVMASNFQHVLYSCAANMAKRLGIEASDLLPTIVRTTAEVAMKSLDNPVGNITGPAARGDSETIEKHREALLVVPEVRNVYDAMTAYITQLMQAQHPESHEDI